MILKFLSLSKVHIIIIHHGNHDDDGFYNMINDHLPRFKTLTLLPSWQDLLMSVFMGGLTGEGEHHNQYSQNNPHHCYIQF